MSERLKERTAAVATINDIVSAMRAIAAARIHDAQRVARSARAYDEVAKGAIAAVLAERAADVARPSKVLPVRLVVFTSEQGLCGTFNNDVVRHAQAVADKNSDRAVHISVVGRRGVRQMRARGMAVESAVPAATSVEGIHDLVRRVAIRLGRAYGAAEFGELVVVYSRHVSLTEQEPTAERVLPLVSAAFDSLEQPRRFRYHGDAAELLDSLVGEWLFITLFRLAAESFASEQASRLVAMDTAVSNTDRMLASLQGLEQRERQLTITRQVLESITARTAARRSAERRMI